MRRQNYASNDPLTAIRRRNKLYVPQCLSFRYAVQAGGVHALEAGVLRPFRFGRLLSAGCNWLTASAEERQGSRQAGSD